MTILKKDDGDFTNFVILAIHGRPQYFKPILKNLVANKTAAFLDSFKSKLANLGVIKLLHA